MASPRTSPTAGQASSPDSPASIPNHPTLLGLPAELRLEIYDELLNDNDTLTLTRVPQPKLGGQWQPDTMISNFKPPIALLHLCRLIRTEAKGRYLKHMQAQKQRLEVEHAALVAEDAAVHDDWTKTVEELDEPFSLMEAVERVQKLVEKELARVDCK
ncbi:hypothetical protein LTR85_006686 [Meristemomyces frigidus]|nr:hypothetical protein LTR85_006686 [Meristemomyces frigidus]